MKEPRIPFFETIPLFVVLFLLLVACGGETPDPTTLPERGTPSAVTRGPRATLTPGTQRVTASPPRASPPAQAV